MDFREATDGIPLEHLARALGLSRQTVKQLRLHTSSAGHRTPPANWKPIVARILDNSGDEMKERAALLMADD